MSSLANIVPAPVRNAVSGTNPVTKFVTGPLASVAAACVTVPVAAARGFVSGLPDAIDTTPAKSGFMEGAPRWMQNIGEAVGSAAVAAGIATALSLVGVHLGASNIFTISVTLGALDASPLKQTVTGVGQGINQAIVKGYDFAKTTLGNR